MMKLNDSQECKKELLRLAQYEDGLRRLLIVLMANHFDKHGSPHDFRMNLKGDVGRQFTMSVQMVRKGAWLNFSVPMQSWSLRLFRKHFDHDRAIAEMDDQLRNPIRRKFQLGVEREIPLMMKLIEELIRSNADPVAMAVNTTSFTTDFVLNGDQNQWVVVSVQANAL